MQDAIRLEKLTHVFPSGAGVRGIDLVVPKGSVFGLLGPNGAGKTTLMKIMTGLLLPDFGILSVEGVRPGRDQQKLNQRMGVMIGDPDHYTHLTGRASLDIYRTLRGLPREETERCLAFVDLADAADKRIRDYSMGMNQRLALARALLGDPNLLILDEPTNGLDPHGVKKLLGYIQDIAAQKGRTVIVSSHVLQDVEAICSHVAIMSEGRIRHQGPTYQIEESGSGISLRTGDKSRAKNILARRGYNMRFEGDEIVVEDIYEDAEIAQLVQEFVADKVPVFSIEKRTNTLADVFAEHTRHTERAA